MRPALIGVLCAVLLVAPGPAAASNWYEEAEPLPIVAGRVEDSPQIANVMRSLASELLADPTLLSALRQASGENDDFTVDTIIQRDIAWRLQSKRGRGPLLESVLGGGLSQRLTLLRFPRQALLSDLMLTDDRGLLVGATRIPSDYDQSDEAKYMVPVTSEPGMVHVEDAAYDESADDYVVMASILLVDPADTRPLGVLCVNFTLAALQRD
ncbi:MAG: hypothetical protein ACOVN0_18135 [Niveispirillum sp.]|uniref:hypothetical protein n=1 Tax=Niveispirillum sp. TaxID=1917217 RepID=UPI003BA42FA8